MADVVMFAGRSLHIRDSLPGIHHPQPLGIDALEDLFGPGFHVAIGIDEQAGFADADDVIRLGIETMRLHAGGQQHRHLGPLAGNGAGKIVQRKEGRDHLQLRGYPLFPAAASGQDERSADR